MDKENSKTLAFRLAQEQHPILSPDMTDANRRIGPTGSAMLIDDGWTSTGADYVSPGSTENITIMDASGQEDTHIEEDEDDPDGRC